MCPSALLPICPSALLPIFPSSCCCMYIKATWRTDCLISPSLFFSLYNSIYNEHFEPKPIIPYHYFVLLGTRLYSHTSHTRLPPVRILHRDHSRDPVDPYPISLLARQITYIRLLCFLFDSPSLTYLPSLPLSFFIHKPRRRRRQGRHLPQQLYIYSLLKAHQCEWDCAPLFTTASYASDHLYLTSALVRWRSSFTRPDIRP